MFCPPFTDVNVGMLRMQKFVFFDGWVEMEYQVTDVCIFVKEKSLYFQKIAIKISISGEQRNLPMYPKQTQTHVLYGLLPLLSE